MKSISGDSTCKTICLVDFSNWQTSGHCYTFIQIYSKILLELGCDVVALCRDPSCITDWVRQNIPGLEESRFRAVLLEKPRRPWWLWRALPRSWRDLVLKWMHWRNASQVLTSISRPHNVRVDGVLFAYFEDLIPRKGRLPLWLHRRCFTWPWAAVSFNSGFYRLAATRTTAIKEVRRAYHLLNAPSCRALCILDEKIQPELQSLFPRIQVHLLPDTTDESAPDLASPLAREILDRAAGRKIISLLGMQEIRKGTTTLLEVARRRPDLFFLFAGPDNEGSFKKKQRSEIRQFFDTQPDNCLRHMQRVPDGAQFNALAAISDILFCGYLRFTNSSQLMVKAALFKRPVIVSQGYLCHERMIQFNLGTAIKEGDVDQCCAAIDHLLSAEGRREKRNYDEFVAEMCSKKLKAQLARVLTVFDRN